MKPSVSAAATALEQLATSIVASYGDDRAFNEIWGWNLPPLNRHDLAELPGELAVRLRTIPDSAVGADLEAKLAKVPARVTLLIGNSLPNLPSANAFHVAEQVSDLVEWIGRSLPVPPPPSASVDWKEVGSQKLLPPQLLRRLRGIEAHLNAIEPRTARISEQVDAIEAAHEAAESLPTDLATLQEATADVETAKAAAETASTEAESLLDKVKEIHKQVEGQEKEAAQLVRNCGEAYRVTTTKGLAASFEKRAVWLNISVVLWVVGLLAALGIGGYVAAERFSLIQDLLKTNAPAERLWVHTIFALLSVGAPVWFAWIATKQIGQRFRLAEDYAFKASVAKAYEGYRREAARIDPEFEARLFGSALTRLEEAPLRLVEHESYGSPWHELTCSPAFSKALGLIPELKSKYLSLLPPALAGAGFGASAARGTKAPSQEEA